MSWTSVSCIQTQDEDGERSTLLNPFKWIYRNNRRNIYFNLIINIVWVFTHHSKLCAFNGGGYRVCSTRSHCQVITLQLWTRENDTYTTLWMSPSDDYYALVRKSGLGLAGILGRTSDSTVPRVLGLYSLEPLRDVVSLLCTTLRTYTTVTDPLVHVSSRNRTQSNSH